MRRTKPPKTIEKQGYWEFLLIDPLEIVDASLNLSSRNFILFMKLLVLHQVQGYIARNQLKALNGGKNNAKVLERFIPVFGKKDIFYHPKMKESVEKFNGIDTLETFLENFLRGGYKGGIIFESNFWKLVNTGDEGSAVIQPHARAQEEQIPPKLEWVAEYCEVRQNGIDPEDFMDWYTSNGWKVGKNPMKNWKSAIHTWEGKRKNGKDNRTYGSRGYSKDKTKRKFKKSDIEY